MAKDDENQLRGLPFVIGGLSFIPLIGIVFGLVAIVWGLSSRKQGGRKLAAIGASGIAFTFVVYGALFYFGFVQRGGVYDDLRASLARSQLNTLVPFVEFYKVRNGAYPASLAELETSLPEHAFVSVYDSSDVSLAEKPRYFFYRRTDDNHYYLRGVGRDGKPFTKDDLLPELGSGKLGGVGLLLTPPDPTRPLG